MDNAINKIGMVYVSYMGSNTIFAKKNDNRKKNNRRIKNEC